MWTLFYYYLFFTIIQETGVGSHNHHLAPSHWQLSQKPWTGFHRMKLVDAHLTMHLTYTYKNFALSFSENKYQIIWPFNSKTGYRFICKLLRNTNFMSYIREIIHHTHTISKILTSIKSLVTTCLCLQWRFLQAKHNNDWIS